MDKFRKFQRHIPVDANFQVKVCAFQDCVDEIEITFKWIIQLIEEKTRCRCIVHEQNKETYWTISSLYWRSWTLKLSRYNWH